MSPPRARIIEDMNLARLAEGTRKIYIQAVRWLAAHYRRSPHQLSEEEVRAYLLGLRQRGVARGTFQTREASGRGSRRCKRKKRLTISLFKYPTGVRGCETPAGTKRSGVPLAVVRQVESDSGITATFVLADSGNRDSLRRDLRPDRRGGRCGQKTPEGKPVRRSQSHMGDNLDATVTTGGGNNDQVDCYAHSNKWTRRPGSDPRLEQHRCLQLGKSRHGIVHQIATWRYLLLRCAD